MRTAILLLLLAANHQTKPSTTAAAKVGQVLATMKPATTPGLYMVCVDLLKPPGKWSGRLEVFAGSKVSLSLPLDATEATAWTSCSRDLAFGSGEAVRLLAATPGTVTATLSVYDHTP